MLYCFLVLFIVILFFFFFKQKTAYELRISDWSSDVCSSDLTVLGTKFSVRRDGDKVSVSVLEGRVRIDDVQTQLETGNSSATITGGVLAVTNGPSTLVTQRAPDRVADALAWRDGMLKFDQAPLSEVDTEFNRYHRDRK